MPVIDVQRNHATVFKIRLGQKIKTRSGKMAPASLSDQLRVTSDNRDVVDAFVAAYGGQTQQWEEGWEAFLPRTNIPILVLPGQSVVQWWELYRGSVCERRCEGTGGIEKISGEPCMCDPDGDVRIANKDQCSLMTRLHFTCPEVAVIGAGALVTHGKIAAETLPQAVNIAEAALKTGRAVPAVLRVVQKTGKNRQYVVPQIEMVGLRLDQLTSNTRPAVTPTFPVSSPAASVGPSGRDSSRTEVALSLPAAGEPLKDQASSPIQQREQIQKLAAKKNIDAEALEELILDVSGTYIDDPKLSLEQGNQILAELAKR